MGFPCQRALIPDHIFRRVLPNLTAVEQQIGKPGITVLINAANLEIFFPELIKTSQIRLFTEPFHKSVPGQKMIVVVIIFLLLFPKPHPFL